MLPFFVLDAGQDLIAHPGQPGDLLKFAGQRKFAEVIAQIIAKSERCMRDFLRLGVVFGAFARLSRRTCRQDEGHQCNQTEEKAVLFAANCRCEFHLWSGVIPHFPCHNSIMALFWEESKFQRAKASI